jgi:putative flippase GtrA
MGLRAVLTGGSLPARIIRYGFSGVLVAGSQFLAMYLLVERLGFTTIILENTANIISIEVSILTGFLLHSRISWRHRFESSAHRLKALAGFHAVTAISFGIRILLFALLSNMGVDYRINTLAGILLAIAMNFFGYDRLIFRKKAG